MLKRKKLVEDFVNPTIKELGFDGVNLVEPYCPLKLKCRVLRQTLSGKPCNKVVGLVSNQTKNFDSDKVYELYVMFANDENGKMTMYCKEHKEDELCKIVDGSFVFDFQAKMFFHLLLFADMDVWRAFTDNLTVRDTKEVDNFSEMVYNSCSLFESQQRVGALFIDRLKGRC